MFKTKSIQSRVLLYSGLLVFGVVFVITSIFYITERQRLLNERISVIQLEVERESAYIEREFSKIYENAQALSFTAGDMIDNDYDSERQHLFSVAERLLKGNPNIVGINLIFEPDVIGMDEDFVGDPRFQGDGQFVSYVSNLYGDLNIDYINNYASYEMYTKAITLKDDFFTEPYYFMIEDEEIYVSTVVFPIVRQGEFLGLVGIDFTADYIFEQMMLLDNRYDRRDIIVSQSGTILLNSKDESDFGQLISSIHTDYEEGIEEVNEKGIVSGRMPNGHFEVLKTVALASTGDYWYIFSDVEPNIVFGPLNLLFYQTSAIALITLLLGVLALYFVSKSLTEPITDLSDVVDGYNIEQGKSSDFAIDTKRLKEIEVLRDNFRKTLRLVQDTLEKNKRSLDLQAKQIAVQKSLETKDSIKDLTSSILETLIQETNAVIGALYLYESGKLRMSVSSGLHKKTSTSIAIGEGLIGRVGETKKPKVLRLPKEEEAKIDFGMDMATPPYMLLYPLVQDKELIGVLQLVSIENFDPLLEDLLDESVFMISASILKQQSAERTNELLEKTQRLASELDQKQQDLEVQNEELESQQEELRVTNEELESQQEELRVTNEELQENMRQVDEMNKDLQEARKALEERTIEAERSNKYKSDFLANMSHELRTPLNSILILSNLISQQQVSESKMKEYAETIHSSGSDLLELINGILDLAKVESGKEVVNIKETNLETLVHELQERFNPLADKSKISLAIKLPEELPQIKTDATKLRLILTNLLSNAIKFTEEGSVTLHVKDEGKDLVFEVIDTGIGIDSDMLNHIFEEFHQVESDSKRSYGGTGLGLSICKRYAQLLHGRINVESKKGEGSTFRLILPKRIKKDKPISTKNQDHKEEQTRVSDEGIISDDRHTLTIGDPLVLVIDDNPEFLQAMRDFFRSKDVNVIVSETGENGLYLADYYLPRIVLVDENLPKMHGQEVVKKLKDNPRVTDCTCYIVSGEVEKSDIKGAPFLAKPLSNQVLNNLVKELKNMPKRVARILLIEDNKTHQDAVVAYLNTQKTSIEFEIDTVATKKEALNFLKSSHYQLLVVDLGLNDASEFDLVKEIRKNKSYKNIPIIVYTGKEFKAEEEKELSELVQDIIIKGEQSPRRLLHDIELFMSQKDKHSVVTDKTLFQGKKILVVDDDIRNVFALTGLLEAYDIKVVYNTAGKDAIDRIKKEEDIDLVLMDIMMPEMNGYETMERIRNEEDKKDLPIIALTAKSMRGDREKCIKAGANEYLSKPLDKDKLLSVLRVWLP